MFNFYGSKREEIRFMVETDGSAKALVFSQFVSFLDLIDYSLQKVDYDMQISIFYFILFFLFKHGKVITIYIYWSLCSLK